jgi:two-component system, cell cycle sensor histidine kinase and response regulator CckA
MNDGNENAEALTAKTFERIGREAAGVAHDFNNFIMGILGGVHDVYEDLDLHSPHRKTLAMVITAAEKASALSKRLLSVGHSQTLPKALNLNHVVTSISPLFPHLLGTGITMDFLPESSLGNVHVDTAQMEQVILNLVVNARDAMPAGGRLTIKTSNIEVDLLPSDLGKGSFVKLEVSDTGEGMDPVVSRRIFEPFFTTKDAAHGTGIGLATLKNFVENNGGEVSVTSRPRNGSLFTILLPRVS